MMDIESIRKDYDTALSVLNKDFKDPVKYLAGLYYYGLQRQKKITARQCYQAIARIEKQENYPED